MADPLIFGSGAFYGINSAANSTPVKVATLQDITFDFSFNSKPLYGQNKLPEDILRGSGKFTGKAKFARVKGSIFSQLFFGTQSASSTGLLQVAQGEAGAIPATTTYTVTVVNSTTFDTDLGVVYAATGKPFTKVSGAPSTAGQYSVAAGVYTFDASDASTNVLIDYVYKPATGGTIQTISNEATGVTPKFMGVFTATVENNPTTLILNACTATKLAIATKLEDYTYPELDFDILVDSSGSLGRFSSVV